MNKPIAAPLLQPDGAFADYLNNAATRTCRHQPAA